MSSPEIAAHYTHHFPEHDRTDSYNGVLYDLEEDPEGNLIAYIAAGLNAHQRLVEKSLGISSSFHTVRPYGWPAERSIMVSVFQPLPRSDLSMDTNTMYVAAATSGGYSDALRISTRQIVLSVAAITRLCLTDFVENGEPTNYGGLLTPEQLNANINTQCATGIVFLNELGE